MSKAKYSVGDKLIVVRTHRWREVSIFDVRVVAVGRIYMTVEEAEKADFVGRPLQWNLRMDNLSSKEGNPIDGRGYPSREAYAAEQEMIEEWSRFRKDYDRCRYSFPRGVTLDDLRTVRALLRMDEGSK